LSSRAIFSPACSSCGRSVALFDLLLHLGTMGSDPMEVIEAVRDEVAVVRPPSWHRFPHAFTHIFAGSYASGYYSYLWAEVLADRVPAFCRGGTINRTIAAKFRDEVLSRGASRPAAESFRAFRGRDADRGHADPAWAGSKPMTPPHAARYAPACRSRFHRFRERMRETVPDIQKPSEDALTPERAAAFALIALGHVTREYPHKPDMSLPATRTYRPREVCIRLLRQLRLAQLRPRLLAADSEGSRPSFRNDAAPCSENYSPLIPR
jgi:hypothetical protein